MSSVHDLIAEKLREAWQAAKRNPKSAMLQKQRKDWSRAMLAWELVMGDDFDETIRQEDGNGS